MSCALPAYFHETVVFPSDMLKEAICQGLRCGVREGRAGLDKVRWLESRYAEALWGRLHGKTKKAAEHTEELCFIAVELVEIYANAGIAEALEKAIGAELSAHDLLQRLAQAVTHAAQNKAFA